MILTPRGHLECLEAFLTVTTESLVAGVIQRVEGRYVANYPTVHRTALYNTELYDPNCHCADEKACRRVFHLNSTRAMGISEELEF